MPDAVFSEYLKRVIAQSKLGSDAQPSIDLEDDSDSPEDELEEGTSAGGSEPTVQSAPPPVKQNELGLSYLGAAYMEWSRIDSLAKREVEKEVEDQLAEMDTHKQCPSCAVLTRRVLSNGTFVYQIFTELQQKPLSSTSAQEMV